jgi:succinate dehydrogenase / fumarate reductase membrane anchor subunit
MKQEKVMKSLVSEAKHLGSAHSGLHHWVTQRLSALALIPLILWFLWQIPILLKADQKASLLWLSSPFNMGVLFLLVSAILYHGALGLQVVLEDYVGHKGLRFLSIVFVQFLAICFWMTSIVMILFLAFGLPGSDVSSY